MAVRRRSAMGRPWQPRRLQRGPFGGRVRRRALLRGRALHGPGLGARELPNRTPGGQVYRVTPDGCWTYCGHPGSEDATPEDVPTAGYASGKADDAFAFTVYRGRLYCASNHRRGAFLYEGGDRWTTSARITGSSPSPSIVAGCTRSSTAARCTATGVDRSGPTAAVRLDRPRPTERSPAQADSTSARGPRARCTVTMEARRGPRWKGSAMSARSWAWPSTTARSTSAPCRWRTSGEWTTSDSRSWAPSTRPPRRFGASGHGRLSGQALRRHAALRPRMRHGSRDRMATWDRAFPSGWRHVAAVRDGGVLRLYVDGVAVAVSTAFRPARVRREQRPPAHDRLRPQRVLPGAPQRPAPLRPPARGGRRRGPGRALDRSPSGPRGAAAPVPSARRRSADRRSVPGAPTGASHSRSPATGSPPPPEPGSAPRRGSRRGSSPE